MTSEGTTDPTPSEAWNAISTPDTWPEGGYYRDRHWRSWEKRFASQVLSAAQRLRREGRLTARELSRRLTAAGWPVTENSVNGIFGKKGRESISVPQLIALAEALGVGPMELLFDPLGSGETEIRPGVVKPTKQAVIEFLAGYPFESMPNPTAEADLNQLLERVAAAALNEHGVDYAAAWLAGASATIGRLSSAASRKATGGAPTDPAQ